MVGRAIPSVASARQFDLELLVPAHLRGMPLLKDTKGRNTVKSPAVWSMELSDGLWGPLHPCKEAILGAIFLKLQERKT